MGFINMRCASVLVLVFTAACNTPSPSFMGADAQTITVDGSTFDLRRKEDRVELIRTNQEIAFGIQDVLPKAAEAVRRLTGCTPVPGTWEGDAAMMRVEIDCND